MAVPIVNIFPGLAGKNGFGAYSASECLVSLADKLTKHYSVRKIQWPIGTTVVRYILRFLYTMIRKIFFWNKTCWCFFRTHLCCVRALSWHWKKNKIGMLAQHYNVILVKLENMFGEMLPSNSMLTLDMCWRWTCVDAGHVVTLDMCWRWTCGDAGHVVTLDMWWRWTCGDAGHVMTLDMCWRWTCGDAGHVLTLDMCWRWTCGDAGHVVTLDMWWRWTCGDAGNAVRGRCIHPLWNVLITFTLQDMQDNAKHIYKPLFQVQYNLRVTLHKLCY